MFFFNFRYIVMADTEDSHSLNNTGLNSVYPGDISQSRDGHMIFSGGAIKQENGGLLGKSSCTGLKLNFSLFGTYCVH